MIEVYKIKMKYYSRCNSYIILLLLFGFIQLSITMEMQANRIIEKTPKWFFASYEKIQSINIELDNRVYIMTKKDLLCYTSDGTLLWKFHPHIGTISSFKVVDEWYIYVQTSYYFYALNDEGKVKWDFQASLGEKIKSYKIDDSGNVYIMTTTEFYSLDPFNGNENWYFNPRSEIKYFKIADDAIIYIKTSDVLYAIDPYEEN